MGVVRWPTYFVLSERCKYREGGRLVNKQQLTGFQQDFNLTKKDICALHGEEVRCRLFLRMSGAW